MLQEMQFKSGVVADIISNNPVEKLFRDAKVLEIYEGTSQVQEIIIGTAALNGLYNP